MNTQEYAINDSVSVALKYLNNNDVWVDYTSVGRIVVIEGTAIKTYYVMVGNTVFTVFADALQPVTENRVVDVDAMVAV